MKLTLDEFSPATYEDWRRAAEESLKGAPFDKKLITPTPEGIKLQPIYGKADVEALALPESWPGLPPFVRGASAAGNKKRPWLVAQELPYGCAEKFQAALRNDLRRGQNCVSLLLDAATRRCLDPDEADGEEVGKCGLSLATLGDAARAFAGVDFHAVPVLAFAGASALPLAGLLQAVTGDKGFSGAVLADPLTEWARDGKLAMSLDEAYAEMAALSQWAVGKKIRTAGIQANLWADAGGTAVEELAFGLATGAAYFRALATAGIPDNEIAPRFVMALSLGSNLFMEIAKLRAARMLWSRIVESFGVPAAPLFLHGRSSLFNKSVLDPHTNMLRATAEGFAGVVGGVDSMHVAAFDELIRTPDEFSTRIARNLHVILSEECGFAEVADAAGGSWYVESLTIELARKAWELFQEVEKRGGMAVALREGFPQAAVAASAKARRDAVSKRRTAILGVNLFPNPAEIPLSPDPEAGSFAIRAEGVAATRKGGVRLSSPSVGEVARAFQAGATIGEIRKALPRKAAPAPEISRVEILRAAEGYERLRAATKNAPPKVWLAKFGPPKQSKARADFSSGFFSAGGFEVLQTTAGAKSPGEALEQALDSKAGIVVVCSTDDTYPEIIPAFVPALKAKMPGVKVLLAGFPADQIEAHKASGVEDFIHLKVDCLAFLNRLIKEL
ncbi:MAG: acyl-CoA mutase large subunit family protein [Chthoniobacterales bacterium]|nr:acyl-CoA mutase large subunit family protein [Chthoniobacterales bacterium]